MIRYYKVFPLVGLMLLSATAFAKGPKGTPEYQGTLKESLKLDPNFFSQYDQQIAARRGDWLKKSEQFKPQLSKRTIEPKSLVRVVADPKAFQGWRTEKIGNVAEALGHNLKDGESFILDFGEHLVGHLNIDLREYDGKIMDCPARVRFTFAEMPSDLAIPPDPYKPSLSRSWFQDEVINFDFAPTSNTLPRRYAFRFVKVEVIAARRVGFAKINATAESSADITKLMPWQSEDPLLRKIDEVACNTLRDCMQTMFEDGPRRDRRLWLGDLRLEAKANYVTFRSFDVVKRSMYMLAGTAKPNGLVSTDCYEQPFIKGGGCAILDYIALYPSVVLEYLEASGDRETAEDLWPLCVKQLDFVLSSVDAEGIVRMDLGWWYFIDHDRSLKRQPAEQGALVYGLKRAQALAKALGREAELPFIDAAVNQMTQAARAKLYNKTKNAFIEVGGSQVALMGQAWPVIAGIVTGDEARSILREVMANKAAVRPRTPYAFHYFVEALATAGMKADVDKWLKDYWGGMVMKGADTFWEAYVPNDDMSSPYGNILMNSYCHAWSCAPVCFLRANASAKKLLADGTEN